MQLPPHRHYGLTDVAGALGVSRQALASYLKRGKMPPPDDHIASGPIWHDQTIEPWITARLGNRERGASEGQQGS
jgi:predicted DNA-binding transcriptional regulator AlpA